MRAYGPDLARAGNRGNGVEEIGILMPQLRAGDCIPACAVPLLNQRLPAFVAGLVVVANRPDSVCRDGANSIESIGVCSNIGTGNHVPTCAIPLLDQRLIGLMRSRLRESHCPDIVAGDSGNTGNDAIVVSNAGTGHDVPLAAVPMFGECRTWIGRTDGPDIVAGDSCNSGQRTAICVAGAGHHTP